jgi:hypothetical protein
MVNHYFLDTSALAKRYIPEIGTSWINRINPAPRLIDIELVLI